jgi:hypothetical protein
MTVTPLYSAAEIDAEIAQAKLDLASARKSLLTQISTGGTDRRVQREQVKALQEHLDWLQKQRAGLEIGHGAQSHVGRPTR